MDARRIVLWMVVVVLAATAAVLYRRQRPYDGVWVVPVRVHLLRSRELPAANSVLSKHDVDDIFTRANQIWEPARIRLVLESVVEEEAANPSQITLEAHRISLGAVQQLRPSSSMGRDSIHVYYVHWMASNGVFQGLDAVFVQDTATLRPVPGGIETPLPRVTAHEIGHAFGLPHREAETNLMASGTTGTSLNDDEIQTARQTVSAYPFAKRSTGGK